MPPRSLVRGRAGPAAQQAPVDPKVEVVAAWLRNEKRSGLYTKEAVKVCRPCLPALRSVRPVACGLRWRHGMHSTHRPVHEPGDAMRLQAALWLAAPFLSSACMNHRRRLRRHHLHDLHLRVDGRLLCCRSSTAAYK